MLKKFRTTGLIERQRRRGPKRTSRTRKNIKKVANFIVSQDNKPNMHLTPRQIKKQKSISRSTVRRIVNFDLDLKNLKKVKCQVLNEAQKKKRNERAERLLQSFPQKRVNRIFSATKKFFRSAVMKHAKFPRLRPKSKKA